jgi:hypothetical protein
MKTLEARAGIEPACKGFADLSLTTWVPRPIYNLSVFSSDSICAINTEHEFAKPQQRFAPEPFRS